MATIIFDLDHTLFDTAQFKADISTVLRDVGVAEEKITATYKTLIDENNGNYDPIEHARFLEAEHAGVEEHMRRFNESSFQKYVRSGVVETLQTLKDAGHSLVLLTKGHEATQKIKLRQSGLYGLFDSIAVLPDLKETFLQDRYTTEQVYFINDNWHETERIQKVFPRITYVLFVRSDAGQFYDRSRITTPQIEAIPEVLRIIE